MAGILRKLVFVLILMVSPCSLWAAPPHSVRMYHKQPFEVEQVKFYPSDRIYAVLEFREIPAGEYGITADWILPSGKIVKQVTHSFSITEKEKIYQVPFYIEIHAKGPIGQMFSGSEYNAAVYGEWKVIVYCNGEELSETVFQVTESVI